MCPAWGGGRVRALWLRARCLLLSLPPLPVTVQGRDWAADTLGAPTTAEVGARAGAHAATFGNPGPMTSALNITKTVSIVFDDD